MQETALQSQVSKRQWWLSALSLGITIIYPVLLTLIAVRVVMTPLFVQIEYHRPGFPADPYGFTLEDRLTYAPYAVDYLINGAGIEYLGDLQFPDGTALYNQRELRHMMDVKIVTQFAFGVAWICGVVMIIAAWVLLRRRKTRVYFYRGLWNGAALTLGIIAVIVLGAVLAWETFFVAFHEMFFTDGTWYFPTSDTLIRLFPEQFWFDAALTIGGIIITTTLITLVALWKRR